MAVIPLCSAGPPWQQCQSLQGHTKEGGAVCTSDAEEDVVAILNPQHQNRIQLAALQATRCALKHRATGAQPRCQLLSPHCLTILYQQQKEIKVMVRLLIC